MRAKLGYLMKGTALVASLCGSVASAQVIAADSSLSATASFPSDRFVPADTPISFTLSRPLTAGEGRLALVVGSTDLSALVDRSPTSLTFRPQTIRLPRGESEAVLYLVRGASWTPLLRAPIKVLAAGGFTAATAKPSASLNMKGQLAEGHSADVPDPARPTYQDFTLSSGLVSTHVRNGWTFRTQSNYLGASRREEALRYGLKGDDTPRFDLSDYQVQLEHGRALVALGHITSGTNRFLVNGFASRGASATIRGGAASLALSATNGSSIVGWDNIAGLDNGDHRVYSATLGMELRPKRPGAVHLDATVLDGSVLPQTGFTRGGIVDAERSGGGGVQLSATTPAQRVRFAAGFSRSRFDNPDRDAQLSGDSALVAVNRETRSARYVEASAALLQNAKLPKLFSTSLTAGYRGERVDPLYRSVAAPVQADRDQHTFDVAGNLGAISLQVSGGRGRDNLDDVASVLTTRTHTSIGSVTVPIAGLLGVTRHASALPQLAFALNRVRQFGDGIPANSDFSASHVPNQVNVIHDALASWQMRSWRLQYRFNRSEQDNRQVGRERADLIGTVNTLTLGASVRSNVDVSVDGSVERQSNRELAQDGRVERVGATINWRPTPLTTLSAFGSMTSTSTEPATSDADNNELRFELARGFDLWRNPGGGGSRGQLFLRYANQSALTRQLPITTPDVSTLRLTRDTWTLSSGVSLRVF
jgi:hypothetical protein